VLVECKRSSPAGPLGHSSKKTPLQGGAAFAFFNVGGVVSLKANKMWSGEERRGKWGVGRGDVARNVKHPVAAPTPIREYWEV
jgi:hypothetical protein